MFTGCYPSLSEWAPRNACRRWSPTKGGVSQRNEAINTRQATEAAALQHSWASLEHHRGHLCTFHRLTVSLFSSLSHCWFLFFFFFGILLCFAASFVLLFAQLFLTHKRKFSEHWHKKKRYEHQNDLCTWIVFANSWLIIDTIRKGSFEVIWDGRILCLSKYWPE